MYKILKNNFAILLSIKVLIILCNIWYLYYGGRSLSSFLYKTVFRQTYQDKIRSKYIFNFYLNKFVNMILQRTRCSYICMCIYIINVYLMNSPTKISG